MRKLSWALVSEFIGTALLISTHLISMLLLFLVGVIQGSLFSFNGDLHYVFPQKGRLTTWPAGRPRSDPHTGTRPRR